MMKTLLAIIMLTTSIYAADLRLVWKDNSDNEAGFEVWRKVDDADWALAPSDLGGEVVPSKPVSFIGPLQDNGVSIRTYRDELGRILIERS